MKAYQSITFKVIEAPTGGQSRIEQAFDSMGTSSAGVTVNFDLPAWASGAICYNGWTEMGFRNPTSKVVRWLTKNVSGNAPYLHQYDEDTDTLSLLYTGNPSDPNNTSLTGHPYTSHSMDPTNSDYYFFPWDKRILKYAGASSGAWTEITTTTTPWSGSSQPLGFGYSPHLFGTNTPGFVVTSRTTAYVVRKSTGVVTNLGAYNPNNTADHQSVHVTEAGDVYITQGRGTVKVSNGYEHPDNSVSLSTFRINAGSTPSLTKVQDAPAPVSGKIGTHTNPRANHLISLGSRIFVLENADNTPGQNRVWELETRVGDTFAKWYLKSWGHGMQSRYSTNNFISIPYHAKGGFLSIQADNPYNSLSTVRACLWKPGDV